jgi:hypothetical protein
MNQYLDQVIARLNSEAAPDLSDASIEKAIAPCIGGRRLVDLAKRYRDEGLLRSSDLHHLIFQNGADVIS